MFSLDGSTINFPIAYLAGFFTFFASCLLPMVPTYLAYISGITFSNQDNKKSDLVFNGKVFFHSLFFVIGFVSIFVLLGALAYSSNALINEYKNVIQKIGAVFLIFLGLFMAEIIKPEFMYQEKKAQLSQKLSKLGYLSSFLFGVTFGFAWTPCIGPVLAVILFWASQTSNLLNSIWLLTVYGLGLGTPFLIVGLFFEYLSTKITKLQKYSLTIQKIGGLIVLIFGILLLTDQIGYTSRIINHIFHIKNLSF